MILAEHGSKILKIGDAITHAKGCIILNTPSSHHLFWNFLKSEFGAFMGATHKLFKASLASKNFPSPLVVLLQTAGCCNYWTIKMLRMIQVWIGAISNLVQTSSNTCPELLKSWLDWLLECLRLIWEWWKSRGFLTWINKYPTQYKSILSVIFWAQGSL